MRNDVVVCLSGGMDSTLLATMALKAGRLSACVSFRYGQPNLEAEGAAASLWCRRNNVPRAVIDVPCDGSSLAVTGSGPRVVHGRNMIILSVAVGHALSIGANEVWFGATSDDATDYPDCKPEFINSVANAASAYGIKVLAPLAQMTKVEVAARCAALGIDIANTWTCYAPVWSGVMSRTYADLQVACVPCGECAACMLRESALSRVRV